MIVWHQFPVSKWGSLREIIMKYFPEMTNTTYTDAHKEIGKSFFFFQVICQGFFF